MILLLSGSSACGKNTIIKELLSKDDNLEYIKSFTSREMRKGESEGQPYHFITKESFQEKIKANDFFEHELIHNNFYGVEKNLCKDLLITNKHLLKDMGVIGTFNLKEQMTEILVETIFLFVSKRELKKRLKNRGDSKEQIKLRLKRYKFEKENIFKYNYVIENNNKENTLSFVYQVLKNNDEFYNYIKSTKSLEKINLGKLKKYCNKLINNKIFKPIKVFYSRGEFVITNDFEKYLASIITKKNVTKNIVCVDKTFNILSTPSEIVEFTTKYKQDNF